jgi:hypothetical protein
MERSEGLSQAVSDQKIFNPFEYPTYMHYGALTEPHANLDLTKDFDLLPLILDIKCTLNGSAAI